MKGVESAEPDLKNSLVSVKGVFETSKLLKYVYKRTGKQATIVKQEGEKKEEAKEGKEEKKAEDGDKYQKGSGEGEENKEKKEGEGEGDAKATEAITEETKVVELKKNEYYYNPPTYGMEFYAYPGPAYPPQIFSDENPNAYIDM